MRGLWAHPDEAPILSMQHLCTLPDAAPRGPNVCAAPWCAGCELLPLVPPLLVRRLLTLSSPTPTHLPCPTAEERAVGAMPWLWACGYQQEPGVTKCHGLVKSPGLLRDPGSVSVPGAIRGPNLHAAPPLAPCVLAAGPRRPCGVGSSGLPWAACPWWAPSRRRP